MSYTLYPHQRVAAEFLAARTVAGLFDEQGLGKTAAAITACGTVGAKRILVVAPVVVAHNWAREFRIWAPTRSVQLLTSGRTPVASGVEVVVTTHALLRSKALHAALCREAWDVVIADEAHAFKNPKAAVAKAFYGLTVQKNAPAIIRSARRVWVLTGTPMPNNPTELWTMLASLVPDRMRDERGRVMSWHVFRGRYCTLAPVPFGDGVKITGANNVPELRAKLSGFAMRRLKSDHLDLPPLRWGVVEVPCDGPLPPQLREIEDRVLAALPPKATPEDFLAELRNHTEFSTWRRLCGIAKASAVGLMLAEELEEAPLRKVVVFAHHTEVVTMLDHRLHQYRPVFITGDTNAAQRQAAVDEFQTNPYVQVAICQIVAGGVGITLTAAADVVFAERSFVPGENRQAADRCHRIGQTVPVLARVCVLAGSVDALVADILQTKETMISEVLK